MAVLDLALSSGGTKGLAFAGALGVLEEEGHQWGKLIGTSAGAITAGMLAVGYSTKEWLKLVTDQPPEKNFLNTLVQPLPLDQLIGIAKGPSSESRFLFRKAINKATDEVLQQVIGYAPKTAAIMKAMLAVFKANLYEVAFQAFMDGMNSMQVGSAFLSFLERGGFYGTEEFRKWLFERFRDKIPKFNMEWSFTQLYKETQKDLSVVVADTTGKESLILNHRTAPNCPVVEAVRMSMSVPLVWQEIVWKKEWGTYLDKDVTDHVMVDGGAMLNFPIEYIAFPESEKVKKVMGLSVPGKSLPLGILLDDQKGVAGEVESHPLRTSHVLDRLERIVDCAQRWEDELAVKLAHLICRIPTRGFSPLDMNLKGDRLESLVNSGRCGMADYLKRYPLAKR